MEPRPNLRKCLMLLPGYELDGFPRSLPGPEAGDVLAGWVALWHPRLIVKTQTIPAWHPASTPPSEIEGCLFVLPTIAKNELSSDFQSRIAQVPCFLIEPKGSWRELQVQLLRETGVSPPDHSDTAASSDRSHPESSAPETVVSSSQGAGHDSFETNLASCLNDFAALGFAYLQIQLMTRQLRYTSNLDQLLFGEQVVQAAEATLEGDWQRSETLLQACFDTLGQERDHYYSLDVNLLDVTLLGPTTLGRSLRIQLDQAQADESSPDSTILASAQLLAQLKESHPETFDILLTLLSAGKVSLAGGLERERPHPLMTREALTRDLQGGRRAYESLGFVPPTVFARLSYGLTADSVADLRRSGFDGVFLIPWMEGTYPQGSQAKISWESSDGTYLAAIATNVFDANDPSSFLALGWEVGEALDHQHVPTLVFAHWPNSTNEFYELLQVIARRTPALGRWKNANDYFGNTDEPYHQERLTPSAFRYNWLANTESSEELLNATKSFQILSARTRALQNLLNAAWQLEKYRKPEKLVEHYRCAEAELWGSGLDSIHTLLDRLLDEPAQAATHFEQAATLADELGESVLKRLHRSLLGREYGKDGPARGRLLINPRSCPLRIRVQSPADCFFQPESWNFASGRVGHDRYTCIDVPSMGFVVAPLAESPPAASRERPLAETSGLVQNEFLEAQIDTSRGHLKSLHVPARRGNRLSLMIARRDRGPDGAFQYSEMIASDVRMLTASNICGLVRATGRLEMSGKVVGKFEIDYETWRGSRILEIAIRLRELQPLADKNPWRSAFVARLAWPTESAILRTFSAGRRHPWASGQAVSPTMIEIDEADYRTHLLTGGLAFHRRTEERFMETLLTAGSSSVEHRIGIGVDLPHPSLAAADFLDVRYSLPIHDSRPPKSSQGWLANADVKNVVVDLESPLMDDQGETVGVRLFLTECAGRSTNTRIRLMHDVSSANRVDFLGNVIGKLTTKNDSITIALRANEQCNVDVLWK